MAKKALAGQDYFAVDGIASYCMVSRSTVRRWILSGKLKAIKLPSGQARVSVPNFTEFLRQNNMPFTRELN
jgi:excisionase family DNA binding protein